MGQRTETENMPFQNAFIANPLGSLALDPDYMDAKSGDVLSALRLAKRFVIDSIALQYSKLENPLVLGVVSLEATGHNAIPQAAAALLATKIGADLCVDIVQSTSPQRTSLSGLDRIFNRPEFSGKVEPGRNYILVDDTITQGGTFAALTEHIESHGGNVVGVFALSGKEYSAKIALDNQTLHNLRDRFGDIENAFEKSAGRRFDQLTQSEAHYLVKFKQADKLRSAVAEVSRHRPWPVDDESPRQIVKALQEGLVGAAQAPVTPSLQPSPSAWSYLSGFLGTNDPKQCSEKKLSAKYKSP